MRPGAFLVFWVLLCTSLVCWNFGSPYAQGSVVTDFLDAKEDQVKRIAVQSAVNEANTCALVANCSLDCTRRACFPRNSDTLTCAYVAANTNCKNATGGEYCQNVLANYVSGYALVNANLLPLSAATDDVPFEVQNSVCSQRLLDPLFIELQKLQNASLYFNNFYFGSIDGTFRYYPGVESSGELCYDYDPRIRPWYTGTISVLKDLIIVLDTGFTMRNYMVSTVYDITTLSAAQTMTMELLTTLTSNDRVTIVTFDASSTASVLGSIVFLHLASQLEFSCLYNTVEVILDASQRQMWDTWALTALARFLVDVRQYVIPGAGLNLTDSSFLQLQLSVNSTTAASGNSAANFSAAFIQALSTFSEGSPSESLKMVVLFSDGFSSTTDDLSAISQSFLDQNIRLFLYDIVTSSSRAISQLACKSGGRTERLNIANVISNPLFALNSYFTYLAHSQAEAADGAKPFWQRIYPDAGSLGNIITVAYPVMSADNSRLIGVAGIDVQIDGLGLNFKNLLDNNLVNFRRNSISVNANATAITPCNPVYNDSLGQCSGSNVAFSPFCNKDDNSSSFENLVCCADCGLSMGSKSRHYNIPLVILPVLALLIAISLGIYLVSRYKSSCLIPREPKGPPDPLKIPRFSYQVLSVSTANFSAKKAIGSGNYGKVFKGVLPDGSVVAVKKLFYKQEFPDSDFDFEAEVRVLATANHTNLVALKGFCDEPENLLVYEFVENSDLQAWLFEMKFLPWDKRVTIAQGVARGLNYLHRDLQNKQVVCHSDLKPANILLDADFNPKVADFGMATLFDRGSAQFTRGGTFGYTAPELLEGAAPATTQTDVFSYGIVLLEIVTGRKSEDPTLIDFAVPGSAGPLRAWAETNVAEGTEDKIIDQRLGKLKGEDERMAKILIQVALECTSRCPMERPDMSKVMKMIEHPPP